MLCNAVIQSRWEDCGEEEMYANEQIYANEQGDHLIGEAEEAVDNLVGVAEEVAEQRQDDTARRQDGQDVDADIQQEEYDGGNGQVQGGRRPRQRRVPRWHEYEMGDDY